MASRDTVAEMYANLLEFLKPHYYKFLGSIDPTVAEIIYGNEELIVKCTLILFVVIGFQIFRGMRRELPPALDPDEWIQLPLIKKESINHNTRLFRFGLRDPAQPLGLPIGQHISIKAIDSQGRVFKDDKGDLIKAYTPISTQATRGYVDFVIKIYPNGRMTKFMDKLIVGDILAFKGPKGHFRYEPNMKRKIGMIAGGTGITPMFQVIQAILNNPKDRTQVKLIYANVTEEDILLRKELDAFAAVHKRQFQIHYVLDKPPAGWTGGQGYVTKEMIQDKLWSKADEDTLVLRCGPPPMVDILEKHLSAIGYDKSQLFAF